MKTDRTAKQGLDGSTTSIHGSNSGHRDTVVSVILPTYNRANTVGEAIESVLRQSYNPFELVVVDGGSTDHTPAIVESFSDARLRYHRRAEPAGVSTARNIGVNETSGEFVAFIDSDDRWREDKLHRQVTAIRDMDPSYAVAYSGVQKEFGEPRTRNGASGDIEAAIQHMAVPTYTSTLLIRRQAFDDRGGFDDVLPCYEDWDLCLRLAAKYRFQYLDTPLVVKGTAGDNISADPDRLVAAIRRLTARYALPRETIGRLLADAGVTYCEAGNLHRGRSYLLNALRHNPRQPNAIAALGLSLLGSPIVFNTAMERVYALHRWLAP